VVVDVPATKLTLQQLQCGLLRVRRGPFSTGRAGFGSTDLAAASEDNERNSLRIRTAGCRRADRWPAGGARRSPAAPPPRVDEPPNKLGRNPLKFDAPQLMTAPDVLPNGLRNELTSSTVGELYCRRGGHYRGKVQDLTQVYHPLDFIGE
jgi:hypothetical protein